MGAAEAALIFTAGVVAGTINTVVGSGTLVTFPTLLFFGYAPVMANVSNTIGLVAGGLTGSWGYRHELRGARGTLLRWAPMSFLGGIVGAVVKDPVADRIAWTEYLEAVVRPRSEWKDFYRACREVNG